MAGVELIAAERQRQIDQEGWITEHDDQYTDNQLARAAACYAMPESLRQQSIVGKPLWCFVWPWKIKWFKRTPNDRIRELIKAGALIAAEIDRLQRAQSKQENESCIS